MSGVDPSAYRDRALWAVRKHLGRRPWHAYLAQDLLAAAELAICEAAELYDEALGEFGPYAYTAARHAIEREVHMILGPVRTPFRAQPTPSVSLDEPIAPEWPERTRLELMASDEPSPEHRVEAAESPGELGALIATLAPHERAVVERRAAGATFRELGDELGLSKQRVQQIEKHAIARLRLRAKAAARENLLDSSALPSSCKTNEANRT